MVDVLFGVVLDGIGVGFVYWFVVGYVGCDCVVVDVDEIYF